EWNVTAAWVKDPRGNTVIDFKDSNLHLLNYSVPVHERMDLEALKEHLFTLPEQPDLIPYRTSYYHENWGFCLSHRQYEQLPPGEYEVFVDTTLSEGSLTYGELVIPGESDDTMLFSCHCCHPSLANDNLSGIALCTFLAKALLNSAHRLTYRFLFIPGTIGAITWLARNRDKAKQITHGLTVACVGDPGRITYKRSRRHHADIDETVRFALAQSGREHEVRDFSPYGYDERQYCSPGFNLPVGCLSRSAAGEYPEYHTSGDNLELVQPEYLADSLALVLDVIALLEQAEYYVRVDGHGEPQLGRRGLYDALGGQKNKKDRELAMLWLLNYADGSKSLTAIAQMSGLPPAYLQEAAALLEDAGLLVRQKQMSPQ
ncbi:MAG: DUF4910 domain-containing protein, partial [Candidatus Zixiibacteriota bacterium]